MDQARFSAMGTWGHVVVAGGGPGLVAGAIERIAELEQKWSRFRPDSEVSRLNARRVGGAVVSEETAALVERAQAAARATGGRFDGMVLAAVVAAGCDRAAGVVAPAAPAAPVAGFDPGGIGKGYAADLVVEELLAAGAAGACVNLGGDLRVEGEPQPWVVDVEDPFGGPPVTRLGLKRGAVATSSRLRRAWEGGHHIIDPAQGRPATTDAAAVTVVAAEAWWAEALSTAALVAGVDDGLVLIEALGADGLIVDARGEQHATSRLARFTDGACSPAEGRPEPAP